MGPVGGPAVGQEEGGTGDGHTADRQVHEQRPAPRGVGGEDPTEQQADGATTTGDGAVDAEGPPALGRVGECRGQHGQGGRCQQSAEGALEHPGEQEHGEAGGEATDGRGSGESGQTDHERPLAAEDVGEATAEQQQAAEGQGVAGHDPLAISVGEAERMLGGRQGDIHDGGVQYDHQLGQAEHCQDQPPPVVMGVLHRLSLGCRRIGHQFGLVMACYLS